MFVAEIRKLKDKRVALIIIAGCFILTFFLFVRSEGYRATRMLREKKDTISEWYDRFEDVSYAEAAGEISDIAKQRIARHREELSNGIRDDDYTAEIGIINFLNERYLYAAHYGVYLDIILKQADSMLESGAFAGSDFAISNITQTRADYEKLVGTEVNVDVPDFISVIAGYRIADYILIVQILAAVMLIFGSEGEETRSLLKSKYKGNIPVFFCKLLLSFTTAVLTVLITYGGLFVICYVSYGGADFNAALQSLQEFQKAVYRVTIKEYIFLFLFYKIAAAVLITAAVCFTVILAGSSFGAVLAILIFGKDIFLYNSIAEGSPVSIFKYCNAVAWFDVYGRTSYYANVNVFGNAVTYEESMAVGIPVGILLAVIIGMLLYSRDIQLIMPMFINKLAAILKRALGRLTDTCSLIGFEAYRLLVSQLQWVIIIVLLTAAFIFTKGYAEKALIADNISYTYYLDKVNGAFTEETWEQLRLLKAYVYETDGYREELTQKYENNEISKEEYTKAVRVLNADVSAKDGFDNVYRQGSVLRHQEYKGKLERSIVSESIQDYFFNGGKNMQLLAALASIIMFVVLGRYFVADYNVQKLIKSTYRGSGTDRYIRLVYSAMFSVLVCLVIWFTYYGQANSRYDLSVLDYAVQSVAGYEVFRYDLTMGQIIAAGIAFKVIGAVFMALFMYFLSLWNMKKSVYQIVMLVILLMPPLLGYLGAPVQYVLFNGFFMVEILLADGMVSVVVYCLAVLLALAAFVVISLMKYNQVELAVRRKSADE